MKNSFVRIRLSVLLLSCILLNTVFLTGCTGRQQNQEPAPVPTAVTPEATPSPTPTPEEESLEDFFPYKVGNRWEYEGEGNEYASFIQEVVFQEDNRYQVAVDNGGTVMANVIEFYKDRIVNTYRSGEAYESKNLLGQPSNLNIIILEKPLEKGTFWISEENRYEIVDTNASVTVPAGQFDNCIAVKVNFKDQTSHMLFHYKKGIGLIQSEFRSEGGDPITSRLKKYSFQ